jgi:DNA polymerase III sliding clamp (beta) subunit (PCNA family)
MGNTMKAADLHPVITEAKNFAGRDATLPMLQNVRIEATETQLVAVATDRFLLGVSRADYAGEAFTVSIEGQQVDALLRMAKTASRDAQWREVTIERRDDDSHNVIEFRFNSGEEITVTPSAHEFPKFRQLIPTTTLLETETLHESPVIGFNAAYLAKFAKIAGAHAMRVYARGDKPTVVLIGDDFVGLIMPVRVAEDLRAYQRPAWIAA